MRGFCAIHHSIPNLFYVCKGDNRLKIFDVDFKSLRILDKMKWQAQKNKEAALTATETAELDLYEQLNNLIGLLKVRAFATLRQPTTEQ